MGQSAKDGWYFTRVSWLRQLVDTLHISAADIARRMNKNPGQPIESYYDPVDVEECVRHFLPAMEM